MSAVLCSSRLTWRAWSAATGSRCRCAAHMEDLEHDRHSAIDQPA